MYIYGLSHTTRELDVKLSKSKHAMEKSHATIQAYERHIKEETELQLESIKAVYKILKVIGPSVKIHKETTKVKHKIGSVMETVLAEEMDETEAEKYRAEIE